MSVSVDRTNTTFDEVEEQTLGVEGHERGREREIPRVKNSYAPSRLDRKFHSNGERQSLSFSQLRTPWQLTLLKYQPIVERNIDGTPIARDRAGQIWSA